jgi:hypothetical protein
VPDYGAYQEIVRTDISGDRYTYKPNDIEGCCLALLRALKSPSPPLLYMEPHEAAFDLMAKQMLDDEKE